MDMSYDMSRRQAIVGDSKSNFQRHVAGSIIEITKRHATELAETKENTHSPRTNLIFSTHHTDFEDGETATDRGH